MLGLLSFSLAWIFMIAVIVGLLGGVAYLMPSGYIYGQLRHAFDRAVLLAHGVALARMAVAAKLRHAWRMCTLFVIGGGSSDVTHKTNTRSIDGSFFAGSLGSIRMCS